MVEEWHDTILMKDHLKILLSYLEYNNKKGYEITIPLLRKAFLSCMKIMFHVGFSYGMKYREAQKKNHTIISHNRKNRYFCSGERSFKN